jgi:hypothetical protein
VACRPPFSRQPHDATVEPDEWRLARAAEWLASAYGWGPRDLDSLTDEQLVAYSDAAQDRLTGAADTAFRSAIEAARLGAIFSRDQRQYDRWASSTAAKRPSLRGVALEAAVARIANIFPDNVIMETR